MTFIPAFRTVKAVLFQDIAGEQVQNVLWFTTSVPVTMEDMLALAEGIASWWDDTFAGLLAIEHYFRAVHVIGQDTYNSPMAVHDQTIQGRVASIPLPNNVSLVTTFASLLRGKSFRGRHYLAGIPSAVTVDTPDSNQAIGTFVADVLAAWSLLYTYLPALYDHTIVSHYGDKVARETAITSVVTSYSANQYFDSQRRRLHGRGI